MLSTPRDTIRLYREIRETVEAKQVKGSSLVSGIKPSQTVITIIAATTIAATTKTPGPSSIAAVTYNYSANKNSSIITSRLRLLKAWNRTRYGSAITIILCPT
ncbi:MAG: hypothetical protein ABWW69_03605 [Pyrodictiaceae archaeon]